MDRHQPPRHVDQLEALRLFLEIDRRIQSLQENPQAGRSWEDIKSEFLNSK